MPTGLAQMVARKDASPSELLNVALELAATHNPALNAIVVDGQDVAVAASTKACRAVPSPVVPFLIKDLGMAAVDFPTSNGSKLSENMRWPVNSAMFERVRDTGVVTFGRTASPEFGVGPVTEGQVNGAPTRNPWNLDHTPGGSSGGSGASVAAGIVPAAHGSDGGGSVRYPSFILRFGWFSSRPERACPADRWRAKDGAAWRLTALSPGLCAILPPF